MYSGYKLDDSMRIRARKGTKTVNLKQLTDLLQSNDEREFRR